MYKAQRLHYNEVAGKTASGESFRFNDSMNQFIDGLIAVPNVGVRVSKTAQTILPAGTLTKVTFETEVWDDGANFANSKFTAPVISRYRFSGQVRFAVGADGDALLLLTLVDGVNSGNPIYATAAGAGNQTMSFNIVLQLNAGQTFELYAQNSTRNDTIPASAGHSFIDIEVANQRAR